MREYPGDAYFRLELDKETLLFDKLEKVKLLLQEHDLWTEEESFEDGMAEILRETIEVAAEIGEAMEKIRIKNQDLS